MYQRERWIIGNEIAILYRPLSRSVFIPRGITALHKRGIRLFTARYSLGYNVRRIKENQFADDCVYHSVGLSDVM